jgi:hypothetical protein
LSISNKPNDQSKYKKNRPINELVRGYGQGKWIHDKLLEELALTTFTENGLGITFKHVVEKFKCSKGKAQRKLKNACIEKRDKNGKKRSILFKLDCERKNPQRYFPSCIQAKVIENVRKKQNRLINTTGACHNKDGLSPSQYPLHNAIENQNTSAFLTQLSLLPWQPLNMHNIHLWTIMDKSHYEEIILKPSSINKTKIQREQIGLREVVYKFHKKGSIEIDISCSNYPFQIETDDDVNNFFIFLGQVKDRLAYILRDPRERILPLIDNWVLKYCDFNKDIECGDIGQLMDLNIQIKSAGKAFRLYVKNLQDKFVLRGEKLETINQPITTFMDKSILHPFNSIQKRFDEVMNLLKKLDEIG